jgi:DNA-binding transcriptional LysR family regulator
MKAATDKPVRVVRLAVSNSLTGLLTNRIVARYRATYPAVSIRIAEDTSMSMREVLVSNRAEVALVPAGSQQPV